MRTLGIIAIVAALMLPAVAGADAEERRMVMGQQQGDIVSGRPELMERLEAARAAHAADPESADARQECAGLTYESGDFGGALKLLEPLLESDGPGGEVASVDALMLAARIEYLRGQYDEAEGLLRRVLEVEPANVSAVSKLAFVYYQTNQYDKCRKLPVDATSGIRLPHLDLMLAFEDEPYRAVWEEGDATSVPFLVTDPLPVIEVEVDGRKTTVLIDTGGDCLILDPGIAAELGIEVVASMMGMFAGGMEAEVGFARAKTLKLGGVTLRSVPIAVLPTGGMEIGGHRLEGIVGTSVLKQFLATLDYPNDRLVLRSPSGSAASKFLADAKDDALDEVPFYLQSTHFLMAQGSLNGVDGLVFHVDSGLAGTAAFSAPQQTLEYVGIPVPEVEVHPENIGGGGGGFATGAFDIAELGLGRLRQTDLAGSFGALLPQSFMMLGFIQDGLISHNFLRQYAWTLDFEGMRMIFTE
jgi:hypothetical protein